MAMKKCPMCGVEIDENLAFCPYCGAKNQQNQNPTTQQPQVVTNGTNATPISQPKKHTGAFIGGLICFIIMAVFFFLYALQYLEIVSGSDSASLNFIVFLLYVLTVGWITLFPTIILIIVTGVCSGMCLKSTSKAIKVISIIILVIDLICAFLLLVSFAFPSMGVFGSSIPDNAGSTAFGMFF